MKILYSCVILIDNKLYFAIIFKKYKNLKWYLILSGTIEHLTRKEERKGRDISYHKEEEREREREREREFSTGRKRVIFEGFKLEQPECAPINIVSIRI